ncbi:MAG TPA: metalloregulator ArsR/SmtB family transcription factor [Acidobacteriota bacterium]|nr:metalloregulator ArsR/SmtB family transcription factor [Acidobacteriota bacterium]HRV06876.1 metalloregulator ArsR/SmtB family transcription factor [Acidobacteriota bacterium]
MPILPKVKLEAVQKARLEAQARVIKALAHPTRLLLVQELAKGERCVCDLTHLAGADISTVSKHLSLLRSAGVLVSEKRGTQVFYRLNMPCVLKILDCIDPILRKSAQDHLAFLSDRSVQ